MATTSQGSELSSAADLLLHPDERRLVAFTSKHVPSADAASRCPSALGVSRCDAHQGERPARLTMPMPVQALERSGPP